MRPGLGVLSTRLDRSSSKIPVAISVCRIRVKRPYFMRSSSKRRTRAGVYRPDPSGDLIQVNSMRRWKLGLKIASDSNFLCRQRVEELSGRRSAPRQRSRPPKAGHRENRLCPNFHYGSWIDRAFRCTLQRTGHGQVTLTLFLAVSSLWGEAAVPVESPIWPWSLMA